MPPTVAVSTGSQHQPPLPAASSTYPLQQKQTQPLFPFSLKLPFQSNTTSLAQSTAEGKAIPIDLSTAQHRTSALREIHHNFPSRHRYAKSTGAQNTTFSEPVIVRSYYNPQAPSRPHSVSRGGKVTRKPTNGTATFSSNGSTRPSKPKSRNFTIGRLSVPRIMAKISGFDESPQSAQQDGTARLPPVEAFSFKSFLDNVNDPGNENDISADLDRIAEICARSKYSLSNRYEVHHAPHGSGSEFLIAAQQRADNPGPTLQAITSDDEQQQSTARKRRRVGRRNSRAMGTLETIMSSSRSSEEDRSKKKSARELTDEIRGRVALKHSSHSSPTASSPVANDGHTSQQQPEREPSPRRRASTSLALIDNGNRSHSATRRASVLGLVSEPAEPQECANHLEIRTSHHIPNGESSNHAHFSHPATTGAVSSVDDTTATGLLSSLADWMPWNSQAKTPRKAEGRLRELLKSADSNKSAAKMQPQQE